MCSPGRSSGVGAPRGEGRPRGPRGLRERPCSRCRPGARGGAPTPGPYTPHAPSFYSKALTVTRGRHPPPPTSDPHKGPALAEPQATDGGRGREGARAPRPPPAYATPGVGPRERARCPAETPAPRASRGLGAPSSVTSVLLVLFFFFLKGNLRKRRRFSLPPPRAPHPGSLRIPLGGRAARARPGVRPAAQTEQARDPHSLPPPREVPSPAPRPARNKPTPNPRPSPGRGRPARRRGDCTNPGPHLRPLPRPARPLCLNRAPARPPQSHTVYRRGSILFLFFKLRS